MGAGYFGKLPSRGDFVSKRISPQFIDFYDNWLQEGILDSRSRLGDSWLQYYLCSPVWHFVIGTPISSRYSWAGVLLPSVDRSGRYFPFTMVSEPRDSRRVDYFVNTMSDWYLAAQALSLTVLTEGFAMEAFDRDALALCAPPSSVTGVDTSVGESDCLDIGQLSVDRNQLDSPIFLTGRADQNLTGTLGSTSLWWTEGSASIDPVTMLVDGLPDGKTFTAMINGRWPEQAG